jgi:hypothetical protein
MALVDYNKQEEQQTEYLPSGVRSPDSDSEMMVIKPFRRNENGKYRAVDLETGWRGWVEFTPPAPPVKPPVVKPPPTQEELDKRDFMEGYVILSKMKIAVDQGLMSQEDYDIELAKLKAKFKTDYLSDLYNE